jgi:hypothetical protein
MIISLIGIFFTSFLAFSLSAICGGGAGLILIPILGRFLPLTQVPAALSIGTASSSISRIIAFYPKIRWDVVKWFVPAALPAVWLGAWLLSYVNPIYLQLLMGLFLVSNLPMVFKKEKEDKSLPLLSSWFLLLIGFLSGFVSGLTGAVGLLFNSFYLRYGMTKEEIVATRAANEVLLHILKLFLYASFGLVTGNVISLGIAVAVAAIASSFFMKWILPRLSESIFKKLGYSAMVLSGFIMLGESGNRIVNANNASLSFLPISSGLETKVQWKTTNFSIEFAYEDGFEYEQVIPITDLPIDKQEFLKPFIEGAETVIIEEVFGLNIHFYEAYIIKQGKVTSLDLK